METKELRKYISQLDDLLPTLMKHLQISDSPRLLGDKITLQQYLALNILAKRGKCMVTELSQFLDVALSTMTELTGRLLEKRLVKKNKDLRDRRIVWVSLTDMGVEVVQKINERKQEFIARTLEKLVQHERQILIDILNIVSRAIQRTEVNRA